MAKDKKSNTVQTTENNSEATMSDAAVLDTLQTEIDLARAELEKTKLELEQKKHEIQLNARREIDAVEMRAIDKQISRTNENKAAESLIEEQKKIDNVMVTGRFMNRRAPGNSVKLTYLKYADDPVKWYHFEDGKVYTIPTGFAEQINNHYHKPKFTQKQDLMDPNAPATAIHEVDTSDKIYAFVPVSF